MELPLDSPKVLSERSERNQEKSKAVPALWCYRVFDTHSDILIASQVSAAFGSGYASRMLDLLRAVDHGLPRGS